MGNCIIIKSSLGSLQAVVDSGNIYSLYNDASHLNIVYPKTSVTALVDMTDENLHRTYNGNTAPSNDLGQDGDIYLKWS